MYAKSLKIQNFKCFESAELILQYPGRQDSGAAEIANVNVIVGENGGGKSSVLRALALAMQSSSLGRSGFVPYRLVRRTDDKTEKEQAVLTVSGVSTGTDNFKAYGGHEQPLLQNISEDHEQIVLEVAIFRHPRGNIDMLLPHKFSVNTIDSIEDERSPAVFVCGYGATRRTETSDYSPSSARRSRGLRYQRIAGLFEDHIALRPLQSWLPKLQYQKSRDIYEDAIDLINKAMPETIRFGGEVEEEDEQYIFYFHGDRTPYTSLSDGYKTYIAWVGDLVGNLADVATSNLRLRDIEGIVLVDEIDLHMHPEWQRSVITTLSSAFPKLQFVFTTHSPLVASTVRKENVFLTDRDDTGKPIVKQIQETIFGRRIEDILLSSYFGLRTTKPRELEHSAQQIFDDIAKGNRDKALEYLDMISASHIEKFGNVR